MRILAQKYFIGNMKLAKIMTKFAYCQFLALFASSFGKVWTIHFCGIKFWSRAFFGCAEIGNEMAKNAFIAFVSKNFIHFFSFFNSNILMNSKQNQKKKKKKTTDKCKTFVRFCLCIEFLFLNPLNWRWKNACSFACARVCGITSVSTTMFAHNAQALQNHFYSNV